MGMAYCSDCSTKCWQYDHLSVDSCTQGTTTDPPTNTGVACELTVDGGLVQLVGLFGVMRRRHSDPQLQQPSPLG